MKGQLPPSAGSRGGHLPPAGRREGGRTAELAWRVALIGVLFVAACGEPTPGTPVAGAAGGAPSPTVRGPGPLAAMPALPGVPSASPALASAAVPAPEPPLVIPTGAVYACVVDAGGERRVAAIELAPKVAALCAKDPEMGPCQYERAVCRRGGGRVFAADGREITAATEAAYNRRVLRIRIKSN